MTFDDIVIALSLLSLVLTVALMLIPVLVAISAQFLPPGWHEPAASDAAEARRRPPMPIRRL